MARVGKAKDEGGRSAGKAPALERGVAKPAPKKAPAKKAPAKNAPAKKASAKKASAKVAKVTSVARRSRPAAAKKAAPKAPAKAPPATVTEPSAPVLAVPPAATAAPETAAPPLPEPPPSPAVNPAPTPPREEASDVAIASLVRELGDDAPHHSAAWWHYQVVLSDLGPTVGRTLADQARAVHASGGLPVEGGDRKRTLGGIFFALAREHTGPERWRALRQSARRRFQAEPAPRATRAPARPEPEVFVRRRSL
jgi:hypothetical protein